MKDGTTRSVRWDKERWCFFYTDTNQPTVCNFDDIQEWHPASIKV